MQTQLIGGATVRLGEPVVAEGSSIMQLRASSSGIATMLGLLMLCSVFVGIGWYLLPAILSDEPSRSTSPKWVIVMAFSVFYGVFLYLIFFIIALFFPVEVDSHFVKVPFRLVGRRVSVRSISKIEMSQRGVRFKARTQRGVERSYFFSKILFGDAVTAIAAEVSSASGVAISKSGS
ncbi:hypothetical protein [Maricaulis sp.]|uniref:hypothetical protein n=1 Tax=Maricaulis sp. TaxID=1486257 RepID=UPI0025BFDD34|nr:hypothetical protein [Maricaulis sp.]